MGLERKPLKKLRRFKMPQYNFYFGTWTQDPVPVGTVGSINASTSITSCDNQDDFPLKEQTFTQALKALEANHKFHMIALCGMGGVGKTRM
ncbi:hypothetical protein L1887_06432 [Cichorium endivia]|nr:hypothetical protein L1887_06432 [Cichorium endivia]